MARTSNQSAYNDNGLNLAVAEAAALIMDEPAETLSWAEQVESEVNESASQNVEVARKPIFN